METMFFLGDLFWIASYQMFLQERTCVGLAYLSQGWIAEEGLASASLAWKQLAHYTQNQRRKLEVTKKIAVPFRFFFFIFLNILRKNPEK